MAFKSILMVLSEAGDVAPLMDAALPLVRDEGAHLEVLCLGIDRTQAGYYYAGATAMVQAETLELAQEDAAKVEAKVRARLEHEDVQWSCEAALAYVGALTTLVARRAQFNDLVILPKPYGKDVGDDAPVIVEAALFEGHAPVLVVPFGKPLKPPFQRAVIAWNQSTEALSAIRAALPLLSVAKQVDVAIIDPSRHSAQSADPGSELCKMLNRHGAKAEVTILAQTLPRVAEVICRHVRDEGADLLVMGAYGHSRFREAILGGATRDILELAEVPVLMAH